MDEKEELKPEGEVNLGTDNEENIEEENVDVKSYDVDDEPVQEKTTEEEIIGFDIKIGEKDMVNYVLYNNYTCFSGVLGLILSVVALIYLAVSFENMDNMMRIALGFIGLLFTVVNPLMLISKSKKQVRMNESFKMPIHYSMTKSYLLLTQGDQWVQMPWKNIYRVKDTGKSIVVYLSRMRAYIWPKQQLGSDAQDVVKLLYKKIPVGRVKVTIKK